MGIAQLVGGPAGGAEEIEAARLHLAGRQEAAHAAAGGAVHALDEVERRVEFAPAGRLVDDALEPSPLAAHPAAGVVARAQVGADAEALDLRHERLLHAPLAAELHERGDAVAQELGHRERGVKTRAALGAMLVGAEVPRIAADSRAFARHADVEEGLAEVVRPSGVRDQPVGRAVAGVHVRVDEAGSDELAGRVDHAGRRCRRSAGPRGRCARLPTPRRRRGSACACGRRTRRPSRPGSIRARDLASRRCANALDARGRGTRRGRGMGR